MARIPIPKPRKPKVTPLTTTTEALIDAGRTSPEDPLISRQMTEPMTTQDIGDLPPPQQTPDLPRRSTNFERLAQTQDADQIMDMMAEATDNFGYKKETWKEVREAAANMDDDKVIQALVGSKRKNQALTTAQLRRGRELASQANEMVAHEARRLHKLRLEGDLRDIELIDFDRLVKKAHTLHSMVEGEKRRAARALASLRDEAGPVNSMQLEAYMSRGGGRGTITAKIDAIAKAAEIEDPLKRSAAVAKATRGTAMARTVNAIVQYRTVQLLSSPRTHVRNLVGNSLTNMFAIAERGIAAGVSKLPGIGSGEIGLREVSELIQGDIQGVQDGWRLAKETLKTGDSKFASTKLDEVGDSSWGSMVQGGTNKDAAMNFLNMSMMWPGRALLASDEFFKSAAFMSEMRALASRQARREGLAGKAATQRIDELMAAPNQEKILEKVRQGEDFLSADEVLEFEATLSAEEKIFYDNYKQASDFAAYQTFTDLPQTEFGKYMDSAMRNPIMKLIVPFYRTPANILAYSAERSPLAFLAPQWWADMQAGGARRDLALARWGMGSGIAVMTYSLVSEGTITGDGPSNFNLRNTYVNDGWRPNSIKLFGKWISYNNLDPFSTQFATIASAMEAHRYNKDNKSILDSSMLIVGGIAEALRDRSFFEGISAFMEAIDRTSDGSATSFTSNFAASFLPQSGLLRTIRQTQDEKKRLSRADGIWGAIQNMVPGWSDDLPLQIGIWGDPIRYDDPVGPNIASPFFTPEYREDVPSNQLALNSVPVGKVSYNLNYFSTRIDTLKIPHEKGPGFAHQELAEMVGKRRRQVVEAAINTNAYKNAPEGAPDDIADFDTRGDILRTAIAEGSRAGKEEFIAKYNAELSKMVAERKDEGAFFPKPPKSSTDKPIGF